MADPRIDVRFAGIKSARVTYKTDNVTIVYSATETNGSAVVGRAVRIMPGTPDTVELVGDGEAVKGKLIKVEKDNFGVVQIRGFTTLPGGTGASLTVGKAIVGDLLSAAEGYIREADSATAAELVLMAGKIEDPTTTTAVVVDLG